MKSKTWLIALPFVATAALYLWTRIGPLDHSLWHDEVFTYMRFIRWGPGRILGGPWLPNNHILFSLLTWSTTKVIGTSEPALRLWSVLPATVGLVWMVVWLYRRGEVIAAATFAVLATTSQLLLELTVQARGYGLAILAMCGFSIAAFHLLEQRDPKRVWIVALGVSAAVGVCTLSIFAVPVLLGGLVVVACAHGRTRWEALAALVGAAAMSTALYVPVARDLLEHASQDYGRVLRWYDVVLGPTTDHILPTFGSDPAVLVQVLTHVVVLTLVGIGCYRLWRQRRGLAVFALVSVFGTYLFLVVFRFHVINRFTSYLVVITLLVASFAIEEVIALRTQRVWRRSWMIAAAACGVALCIGFSVGAVRFVSVPLENFRGVGGYASGFAATGPTAYSTLTNSMRPVGLQYYLKRRIRTVRTPERVERMCASEHAFLFVDHEFKAPELDLSCLEEKGAERHSFDQRGRGRIHVWVWPPPQREED